MNGESSREKFNEVEKKEAETCGREINAYFLRHGEAEGGDEDAVLSERGRQQAREAISGLLEQIEKQGGGAVKFFFSPTRRARETGEEMENTARKILSEKPYPKIRLMAPHGRVELRSAGVIGPLREAGIKDPIEHWLNNPEVLEGKNPKVFAERLTSLLNVLKKVADRLPAGEKIHYICVTHEVPQAALLNRVTGKTLNQLGGNINNCEALRVNIKGKTEEAPKIIFRGKQTDLR